MVSYHPGFHPIVQSRPPVSTEQIIVATPRPYPIDIGAGHLERLGVLLDASGFPARRLVVSSPGVWKLHGETVSASLPGAPVILVPDGERSKTLHTVERVYDALIKHGADRGAGIVAVGGGVLGDTAGFAAATFLRGLALAQVPTTLLAQVDSAIGGKVGVNHPLGKNLIGAFHQPRHVIVDPLVLSTLPRREFRAGLYEVVKYGMTASASLFDRLSQSSREISKRTPEALIPIIAESCRIKGEVVAEDEREAGRRRVLNFGHTAGHAIEAVTRYRRFRHGEAVAYGMLVAAAVAVARGRLAAADRDALAALIRRMGPLPAIADLSVRDIVLAARRDKKIVSGRLHYVLATGIGRWAEADDVTEPELERALVEIGFRA
jgi:3-dehydroquinate synthase